MCRWWKPTKGMPRYQPLHLGDDDGKHHPHNDDADDQHLRNPAAAGLTSRGPPSAEPSSSSSSCERFSQSTWYLGLTVALSYSLTYFWRYPLFVLPLSILQRPVATLFGRTLNLSQCCSLSMTLGFGAAKVPALCIMTSERFFRCRGLVLLGLCWLGMAIEGIGVAVFLESAPWVVALTKFLSSFLSSWLYGGIVTYLEGRMKTDALLAVTTFMYIYAGNLSRGAASVAIAAGVPPHVMPLAVGTVACVLSSVLLLMAAKAPGPSAADVEKRTARTAMKLGDGCSFVFQWCLGIGSMLVTYALLTGIRSYRDLYSTPLFIAALGLPQGKAVDSMILFTVDIAGAVVACGTMFALSLMANNLRALTTILGIELAAVALMVLSTVAFQANAISGMVWQVLLGVSIYASYSLLCGPAMDRLLALTKTTGTCAFIMFLADGCGYVGSTTLLLVQDFGPGSSSSSNGGSSNSSSSNGTVVPGNSNSSSPSGGGGGADQHSDVLTVFIWLIYACSVVLVIDAIVALVYVRAKCGRRGRAASGRSSSAASSSRSFTRLDSQRGSDGGLGGGHDIHGRTEEDDGGV